MRYSKEHEWVELDGDVATVGITAHAAEQLGDVVFVELPEAGRALGKDGDAAVVESVKAASDVYAPLSGEVVEANDGAGRRSGPGQRRSGRRGLVLQDENCGQGRVRRR